jgi:imidazole glycerol-phosphate synthase subunit HisF
MVLKRIIPCLLYDGSSLVKTVRFKRPAYIGDPINAIKIFNEKEVDELLLLDIRAGHDRRPPMFDRVREFASECFMPFSYGGGVSSLADFARLYEAGVEKVVVNSLCLTHPDIVREATNRYGSSSVVGCVDYRKSIWGVNQVYSKCGYRTRLGLMEHCRFISEELGVGEVMLYSVDRDGTWKGYDVDVIREVAEKIDVPLIACGGAGSQEDLRSVLYETSANAAAIGSMAVYQRKGMGVLVNFPRRSDIIKEEEECVF